jgi:hypothetical protein
MFEGRMVGRKHKGVSAASEQLTYSWAQKPCTNMAHSAIIGTNSVSVETNIALDCTALTR